MEPQLRLDTLKRMLALIEQNTSEMGEEGSLDVSVYTDPAELAREQRTLFRSFPILVAHADQLRENGSYIALDIGTTPILVNRDRHGKLHGFINSCRHRGARLATESCGTARTFRCPYHAWTYMDDGTLKHVPSEEAFPSLDKNTRGLVPISIQEYAGFIWAQPDGGRLDVAASLALVGDDLQHFGLDDHVVRMSDVQRPATNWKLVMDAFSEGYHLKSLHKHSVEPYFHDHGLVFDRIGRHSRSVGARKDIVQAAERPESEWDFRTWTTPFYTIFPNTLLVLHPDWISRITVFPDGTDASLVYHDMLVPKDADLTSQYWDKTFKLINEQVFAAEDIAVCEQIQSVARAGSDSRWITGGLETPVLWFHEACREAMDDA